jgi:hypothetical protein
MFRLAPRIHMIALLAATAVIFIAPMTVLHDSDSL